MKKYLYIIVFLLVGMTAEAQQLSNEAFVSLVTCSPGEELYARYGHTAIRVCDPTNGMDWTFNYGLFDFNTEGFYLKFIQGYTYYLLGVESSMTFFWQYQQEERTISEQVLALTQEQKQAIWDALVLNYQPENRTYLYNFVFDNCATRPYYLIKRALGDSIQSTYEGWEGKSYREFIRHYTGEYSWADFGINLLFGPKADQPMTDEARLFLPEELMNWMEQSGYIETSNIHPFQIQPVKWWASWPFGMLVAFLIISLFSYWEGQHKKWYKAIDITVGSLYMLILLIVCYLTFFSLHPLVGFGWRLLIVPALYVAARLCGKCRVQSAKGKVTVLFLLVSLGMQAAPRLKVVVVIDGLNEENMQMMRNYWPEGGLRMMSEEAHQSQQVFQHEVYGGSESVVSIMTGQTPRHHGVAMDKYFDRNDRKVHSIWEDPKEKGIGTDKAYSARAILATTMSDQLKMSSMGKSKIYAIGIRPETSIALAGHGANACCWINPDTRRWVSTTYYQEGLPAAADKMNMSERNEELLSREWTPRLDIPTYNRPTAEEQKKGWKYDQRTIVSTCPAINELVVELALQIQEQEKMGKTPTTDMLLLELTTETPKAVSDRIESAEQEDMHLRVNQDLGYLIEQLTKRVGKDKLEVTVIGIPRHGVTATQLALTGMEVRPFNADRAAALTGTYLMALYGHERWVDGSYGNSIFLNRSLIEQKKLDLELIERQVATFLLEFEGVQMAYPRQQAMTTPGLQESLNKRMAGDVIFVLEPNRQLMQDGKLVLDHIVESNAEAVVMEWKTLEFGNL